MGGLSAYCAELYTYGSLADQEPLKCKLACRAIKAGLNRRQMEDIFGYNFGTQEKINAKIESLADYKPQGRQKNAIAT
jgi:hypothetical protein